MSLLGVPHPQRREVIEQHERGVAGFVRDSLEYVLRRLPVWTNYFWTFYVGNPCPALSEQARQRTAHLPNVRVVEADR